MQVHHLNYDRLGNEDIYTDLITLCEFCHADLEHGKRYIPVKPKISQIEIAGIKHKKACLDFCDAFAQDDISSGGKLNMCNLEVCKPLLEKWLRERGYDDKSGAGIVVDYFSAKRYFVILKMPPQPVSRIEAVTRFKRKMIDKVLNDKAAAWARYYKWLFDQNMIRESYKLLCGIVEVEKVET